MVAPLVAEVIVTVWADVYVPATGVNTGSVTVPVITYVAVATEESAQSVLHAIALYVAPGFATAIGDEYVVPVLHVGADPSLV